MCIFTTISVQSLNDSHRFVTLHAFELWWLFSKSWGSLQIGSLTVDARFPACPSLLFLSLFLPVLLLCCLVPRLSILALSLPTDDLELSDIMHDGRPRPDLWAKRSTGRCALAALTRCG